MLKNESYVIINDDNDDVDDDDANDNNNINNNCETPFINENIIKCDENNNIINFEENPMKKHWFQQITKKRKRLL